ncbi:development protein [Cryptosporidium ryanae]|uniref:development protein n=1 Tax=Cryptosporidium ryanae TaxID=515981 RepID=UPI003519F72D|nr:development protein [Cryptosporidium ryanae]
MPGQAKSKIYYKFKSEKKFKELTYELPALVSHIRQKLREIFDIGEDMEILITPSNKNGGISNTYLSDYELIDDGTYLNVIRLPKDLAKPLCEAANSRIKNTKSTTSAPSTGAFGSSNASHLNTNPSIASGSAAATSVPPNGPASSNNHSLGAATNEGSGFTSTHPSNSIQASTGSLNAPRKSNCTGLGADQVPGSSAAAPKVINGTASIDSVEDAAILSVMQQHGEKFKQTPAQRSEALEQLNMRGSQRNATLNALHGGSVGAFRTDPYRKPGGQTGLIQPTATQSRSGPIYKGTMTASASTDVPADYICHMCGERGHHIRVCPKVNEGGFQKKIRPATGIPRSFLRTINFDEEGALYSEVYCLPDGTFAVLKDAKQLSSTAFLTRTVEDTIGKHMGKSKEDTGLVRNSLTCPICTRLFRYAVLTPCCGETYCQECIINYIRKHVDTASGISPNTIKGHCPHCSTVVSITDLEPNNPIRKSVNVALGLQQS